MKFEIDFTEKEYNELMKRLGKYGTHADGVQGAIKRMIIAVSKFREIYNLPEVGFSRELYRDEDVVVTIRGGDGEINLFKCGGKKRLCRTILTINPDYLSKSVENIVYKEK